MLQIKPLATGILASAALTVEARNEGFQFLDRLLNAAETNEPLFLSKGEVFLGAYLGEDLVAVGGVSHDPYGATASTGRLRHLYVRRDWRRCGIGENLVHALIAHSSKHFQAIRLRTDTAAATLFYEAIGFQKTEETDATHRLDFKAGA